MKKTPAAVWPTQKAMYMTRALTEQPEAHCKEKLQKLAGATAAGQTQSKQGLVEQAQRGQAAPQAQEVQQPTLVCRSSPAAKRSSEEAELVTGDDRKEKKM